MRKENRPPFLISQNYERIRTMTKEERLRSEDMGNYFRVSADNRDLNYDKYFIKGQVLTQADEAYTSNNTKRLDVEGVVKKLLTTEYVRNQLNSIGKGMLL